MSLRIVVGEVDQRLVRRPRAKPHALRDDERHQQDGAASGPLTFQLFLPSSRTVDVNVGVEDLHDDSFLGIWLGAEGTSWSFKPEVFPTWAPP
jgi:hypothetical protein